MVGLDHSIWGSRETMAVGSVQISWSDWEASLDASLPSDVRRLIVGDAPAIVADATSMVLIAGDVESRIFSELPPTIAVLGCSSCSLKGLSIPVAGGTPTFGAALIEGILHAKTVTWQTASDTADARSPLSPRVNGELGRWRTLLWRAAVAHYGWNDRVSRTALEAGVRLIHDDLDGSHRCSQSIEGEGRDHTGDYWHAIMHRREPDYGNSKYWFRHVGSHPIFPRLVEEWRSLNVAAHLAPRVTAAVQSGRWDPAVFVDACESAERGPVELVQALQEMQYREMLHLLKSSIEAIP